MIEMRISVASHHFVVTRVSARARPAINAFSANLVDYGFNKPSKFGGGHFQRRETQKPKTYAASNRARSEFRYHINHFNAFKEHIRRFHINDNMVEWERIPVNEGVDVKFKIDPKLTDLDRQQYIIEYLLDEQGPVARLVEAQTGIGKSYCSMRWMARVGKRTVIQLLPRFMKQWVSDLKEKLIINPKRIVTINGSEQLQSLLDMAAEDREGLPYDIIIIANRTYQNWLKEYKEHGQDLLDMGWACTPANFLEHVGAGARLIDEVHMEFHINFLNDLHTNCKESLSLSATLKSDSPFTNRMYEIAYPSKTRFQGGDFLKYVNAYSLEYRFKNPEKIRTKARGMETYSHVEFEKSLMKHPKILENYLLMIKTSVEMTYLRTYKKGHRMVIYAAMNEMCTIIRDYLAKHFPHLSVERKVQGDDELNLKADLIISTLQSTGTGIDVPYLMYVLLTVAVNSTQSNIQGFGRIRDPKLKDPDETVIPEFTYFVCLDIDRHIDYHLKKVDLLRTRALKQEAKIYGGLI